MDKTNPACSLYVVEGEKGNDDWYRSNVVVKFKTRRAVTNGATISMYGLGLDSNANYNGSDSIEVSDEQFPNMDFILNKFSVFHFEISGKEVIPSKYSNIESIVVTFSVFH